MITPEEAHNIFEQRVKEKHDYICKFIEKVIDDDLLIHLKLYEEDKSVTFFKQETYADNSDTYDNYIEVLKKYSKDYVVKAYITEIHYTYSDTVKLILTEFSLDWSKSEEPDYIEIREKVTQDSPWVRCPIKEKPKKWWEFWK